MDRIDKQKTVLAWAYLVEVLLSACLTLLVFLLKSAREMSDFFMKTNAGWLGLEGVLLAGAIGVWVAHFQVVGTDFGKYLRWAKHENVFMDAFSVGLGSHLIAFVLIIFCGFFSNSILVYLTVFLLIYALINTLTLFKNAVSFLRLKSLFDYEYGTIKNADKRLTALPQDIKSADFLPSGTTARDLQKVSPAKREVARAKGKRKAK